MEQQEIIEGNKLIAEFMKYDRYSVIVPAESILNKGKYHSSWDWLKPVVDKIFTYALAYPEQVKWVMDCSIVVGIIPCWERCLQFIQWHNTQKQQP